jgi:hypothetical protein
MLQCLRRPLRIWRNFLGGLSPLRAVGFQLLLVLLLAANLVALVLAAQRLSSSYAHPVSTLTVKDVLLSELPPLTLAWDAVNNVAEQSSPTFLCGGDTISWVPCVYTVVPNVAVFRWYSVNVTLIAPSSPWMNPQPPAWALFLCRRCNLGAALELYCVPRLCHPPGAASLDPLVSHALVVGLPRFPCASPTHCGMAASGMFKFQWRLLQSRASTETCPTHFS